MIHKKDKIVVLSGRSRGKQGEVVKVMDDRVLVSKINFVKKHAKPTQTSPGGIREKEASIHISSVMLICPKCNQPMRPKMDALSDGTKVRACRKCGGDACFMSAKTYVPRLKEHYRAVVIPGMIERFGLKNPFEVPRLLKLVVNMGVNEAKEDIKALDVATAELTLITAQKPQVRRAKKSISNFKLREGMPIGLKVTLRGIRMYEFLDRLINASVPRIRDFRGLDPRAFDGRGNYNLGLNEQHIFPEVNLDKSPKVRGLNITFVTNAGNDERARELLKLFGVPFKANEPETVKKPSAAAAHAAAPAA